MFGFAVIVFLFIFLMCYFARKKRMLRVRGKILKLREEGRPENIIRNEI